MKAEFPSNLRYIWLSPEDLKYQDADPVWLQVNADTSGSVENLLSEGWRVSHIRTEMQRLGFEPHGRSLEELAGQLLREFTKPERLAAHLDELSDDLNTFYLYQLLIQSLQQRFTVPASLAELLPFSISTRLATNKILKAGLAIRAESGALYIPHATLKALPPCSIDIETIPEPHEFTPAKDPKVLILQMQKVFGLFDGSRFALRDCLRWHAFDHPQYDNFHAWPPRPADAKLVLSEFSTTREISLLPPEPQLNDQSLQQWSDQLELPSEIAEFIYHLLIQSGILHTGSPVQLNHALVQKWLALPPGRQIVILYHLYRSMTSWASWWTEWRNGKVDVKWDYQGYWGLIYIDATLLSVNQNLRSVLLDILSFLPQNAWMEFNAVIDWILRIFPSPASQRYHRGILFSGVLDGWKGWLKLVLRSILTGPLNLMGFADVAFDSGEVFAFCLRHVQDVHWERVKELGIGHAGAVEPDALNFDPTSNTLQVVVPVDPEFLSIINLWAIPAGLKKNKLQYHLDVDRLHKAFERGLTPVDLRDGWKRCTGFDAPEFVEKWWQHWWGNYGHARLYAPQALLSTRDEFTMKELQMALPNLVSDIQQVVTPTAALLISEDADQVLADLERLGYMPKKVT